MRSTCLASHHRNKVELNFVLKLLLGQNFEHDTGNVPCDFITLQAFVQFDLRVLSSVPDMLPNFRLDGGCNELRSCAGKLHSDNVQAFADEILPGHPSQEDKSLRPSIQAECSQ